VTEKTFNGSGECLFHVKHKFLMLVCIPSSDNIFSMLCMADV